ncbi:Hsp33 family molecular chaperone HslO [Psychrobium sp. 1_MG-2023]|uniref:Hsp33 family molecular chaperone HslO n=1 Tax=Psychrobium sp. 1_MG-2023 TaxID=3062624 RepID=UPI0026D42C38|nr:Hsp33 family molecular chaperone HslO [Psychrobium sp. 1_MG-2023]MDP2561928.1 Hsp33 family molecular chaperone HslO [Psychrobium sp. 1_MG-2023]
MKDQLNRYLFDNVHVRGELVQASNTYQEIIENHDYPAQVNQIIGELLAATSMLTALLKFEGDIAVQLQGEGPVPLIVVNGNDQQQLRGVARITGDVMTTNLTELFHKGYMVITITPKQGERYQGIVALDKDSLAECLETYFKQSEQLKTHFWLRATADNAAGMMIQALPEESEESDVEYDHLRQITATIKDEELFSLEANDILTRLYHQEEVRVFDPQPLSFSCTCSQERSAGAIISVGQEEAESIIAEQGSITMHCDYCNKEYIFDQSDVKALFDDSDQNKTLH